jgi:hypothetical protein
MTLLAIMGALAGAACLLWLTSMVEARQLGPVLLPDTLDVVDDMTGVVRAA